TTSSKLLGSGCKTIIISRCAELALISCEIYEVKEKTIIAPSSTRSEKFPTASVLVAVDIPFTETVAPCKALPLSSLTFPVISIGGGRGDDAAGGPVTSFLVIRIVLPSIENL